MNFCHSFSKGSQYNLWALLLVLWHFLRREGSLPLHGQKYLMEDREGEQISSLRSQVNAFEKDSSPLYAGNGQSIAPIVYISFPEQ